MQKIKNFSTFINEDYGFKDLVQGAKKVLKGIGNWAMGLINKIKEGSVPKIPSGAKQGLPMINYFAHGEGNILSQMDAAFSGSKYGEMKESLSVSEKFGDTPEQELENIMKDLPHLGWQEGEGPLNVNSDTLKDIIKRRYKSLTTQEVIPGKEGEKDRVVTGFPKPIFIFGAPGIGKTEIVGQAAEELGVDVIFVDLQFMDPADFLGVPKVVDVASDEPYGEGVTRGNPPLWLPRSNDGKKYKDRGGIIFFDELNRANLPVMNGCMQLFQARRVQDYELPSKWLIVAAGNRPTDDVEEAVKDMPSAFWDRVSAYNYVPTMSGFISHVTGTTPSGEKTASYDYIPSGGAGAPLREIVLPELLAFLQFSRNYFHSLSPEQMRAGGQTKFATPRGWIEASKSLYSEMKLVQQETGKKQISSDEVFRIFAAEVGQGPARAFLKFYKTVKDFKPEEVDMVFNDPQKAPIPKAKDSTDTVWAKLAAVVSKSGDLGKLTPEQYSNAIDWTLRLESELGDFAREYATAFVQMLNAKHPYAKAGPEAKPYLRSLNKFAQVYFVDLNQFREQQ